MKGMQDGSTHSYKQQQLLFILKNFTNRKETTSLVPQSNGRAVGVQIQQGKRPLKERLQSTLECKNLS